MRSDHRRVDEAVSDVGRLLRARRFADARSRLLACVTAWEQQVRLEEDVLYPLFELRLGTAGAGTAAMRGEHRELRHAFECLAAALEVGGHAAAREAHEGLLESLGSHFSREERVVYPALDAMLSDSERGRLLTRIETTPGGNGGPPPGPARER